MPSRARQNFYTLAKLKSFTKLQRNNQHSHQSQTIHTSNCDEKAARVRHIFRSLCEKRIKIPLLFRELHTPHTLDVNISRVSASASVSMYIYIINAADPLMRTRARLSLSLSFVVQCLEEINIRESERKLVRALSRALQF